MKSIILVILGVILIVVGLALTSAIYPYNLSLNFIGGTLVGFCIENAFVELKEWIRRR